MQFVGYGIAILFGALLGAAGMYLTLKDADIIQGYEIRISGLEADNALLRAKIGLDIDDDEYHPENMNRITAKEIKHGGIKNNL